jgi:hypothetical protein
MTEFRIKEFRGYTEADIHAFLRIHSKSFYRVLLPKENCFSPDHYQFTSDFYRALYAGQLFSRISEDIFYPANDPFEPGEFCFIIICNRLKDLAAVLYLLTKAFNREEHEADYLHFEKTARDVSSWLKEGEEPACFFYAEFLNEYCEGRVVDYSGLPEKGMNSQGKKPATQTSSMLYIDICELFYTPEDELARLLRQNRKPFYEVVIPKPYSYADFPPGVFNDYCKAIWIGQLLHRLSDDFLPTQPHPHCAGVFSFILITSRLKALAKVLAYACRVYDWEYNEEECIEFETVSVNYENCLKEGEEIACDGYVNSLNALSEEMDGWLGSDS